MSCSPLRPHSASSASRIAAAPTSIEARRSAMSVQTCASTPARASMSRVNGASLPVGARMRTRRSAAPKAKVKSFLEERLGTSHVFGNARENAAEVGERTAYFHRSGPHLELVDDARVKAATHLHDRERLPLDPEGLEE